MSARVALVTGSSQGIGRAIATRLASDGLSVALNDLPRQNDALNALRDELAAKYPQQNFIVVAADVTSEESVAQMFSDTVEKLGGLDVLVANAGLGSTFLPLVDTTMKDYNKFFDVNVKGVFLCFQHAARQMIKQGRGGRIVAACSSTGKQGAGLLAAYSASKFAVRGLVQAAASELGPHGINVNAYAPGAIMTDLAMLIPNTLGVDGEKFYADAFPLKRAGQPEEIAGVVSFLSSKDSSYMTGQTVTVDGGRFFD